MGIVNERRERLLDLLADRKKMTIDEVAHYFDISLPTARLLCSNLSNEGKAFRMHGGIRYLPAIKDTYTLADARKEFRSEKNAIAMYASKLVADDDVVFLEAGSTIFGLAQALVERFENNELSKFVLFTNSLSNLNVLSDVCEVLLVGGRYRPNHQDFRGYLSDNLISDLRFDYVFMGADGISLENGIMVLDVGTVRFVEILIQRTSKIIILADSSKFQHYSLISSIPIRKVSTIVTDSGLSDELCEKYTEIGVNIVRV